MLLSVGESAPFLHICVSVHNVDRKFGNEMKTIKHVAKYIFLKITTNGKNLRQLNIFYEKE